MAAPQVVQLSVNAWVSFGTPIGGKAKCSGSLNMSIENGAKAQPFLDGVVGVSSGISVGELSLTLMGELGSTQVKRLQQAQAAGTVLSVMVNDAVLKIPFKGIVSGFSLASEPNEPVKYEFKMTGAPGEVQ